MKLLLAGSDEAKAAAYRRAADALGGCEIVGQFAAGELSQTSGLPAALTGDARGVIALERISDQMIDMLVQENARTLYDPPIFDSAARLLEVADRAARNNLWLLPVLPLRLLPVMQRIQEQVAAGILGQLLYVKLTYNERLPAAGSAPPGALAKRGCDALDLLRWLLGAEIVDLQVMRGSLAPGLEDIALLSVVLEDKIYATLDISWSLPRSYPKAASITIEIAGTHGSIRSDALNQNAQLYTRKSARSLNWGSDWHVEALRSIKAVTASDAPPSTLEDLAWAQTQVEKLA